MPFIIKMEKEMNIAFFEAKDWEKSILKSRLKSHRLKFYASPLSSENLKDIRDCDAVSVFICSKVSKEVISALPKLKLIVTRSTGFDHIDLDACKKRGISVCNVPYYGENTVAEHTFALILALSRKVHKSYLRGLADDFCIEGLKGFDLKGKTLGVIGAGHIGQHVIRIAKGFEMKVMVHDRSRDSRLAKKFGFKYSSLSNLLKRSDIITLHLPYCRETHHLIDEKAIRSMKKGAILINTSRGGIVDTNALLSAIESSHIAGAGLDVIEGENLILEENHLSDHISRKALKQLAQDHELIRNENVVFTPHIAFFSQEALERILETSIDNILSFSKKRPQNTV